MQGLDVEGLHPSSKDAVKTVMRTMYDKLYDPSQTEDILLFTERRSEFPNIGTDCVEMSTMKYMSDNAYWINVCMYVNADFRACFNDAITIEKALLQVNDIEYQDFRDDMTLERDKDPDDKTISVNLGSYDSGMEMAVRNRLDLSKSQFYKAGMTEVYNDLASGFDRQTAAEVSYIAHNMLYVINAFNRNGVFRKYVMLVVDSVKKQLS